MLRSSGSGACAAVGGEDGDVVREAAVGQDPGHHAGRSDRPPSHRPRGRGRRRTRCAPSTASPSSSGRWVFSTRPSVNRMMASPVAQVRGGDPCPRCGSRAGRPRWSAAGVRPRARRPAARGGRGWRTRGRRCAGRAARRTAVAANAPETRPAYASTASRALRMPGALEQPCGEHRPELAHDRGGLDAVPHHVAHRQGHAPVGERRGVEPVAAGRLLQPCHQVRRRDVDAGERGPWRAAARPGAAARPHGRGRGGGRPSPHRCSRGSRRGRPW